MRTAVAARAVAAAALLGVALLGAAPAPSRDARASENPKPSTPRFFTLTYTIDVKEIPEGASDLAVWVPVPQSGAYQKITSLRVESPIAHQFERESEYGNLVLRFHSKDPLPSEIPIVLEARVERLPILAADALRDPNAKPTLRDASASRERFLAPDRLVPITGKVASLAGEVTKGRANDVEKARAIYDYVTGTMKYDKSGEGWGRGDAVRACDVRSGNCTDFHALFIGMCRAAGVPAVFQIGFPLPETETTGVIAGYHCWAEFFAAGIGWIPVDCSEAVKQGDRLQFYFGSLDPDRVMFTVGRDIRLDPDASPDPVNYFIYPIVRVDGKTHEAVTRGIRFEDRPS